MYSLRSNSIIILIVVTLLFSCDSIDERTRKTVVDIQETGFYWKQFPYDSLNNFDSRLLIKKDLLVRDSQEWTELGYPAKGYGTFRFKIEQTNRKEHLGLKIPRVKSACDIWVNGTKIYSLGSTGTSETSMTANGNSVLIALPQEAILDVIIPVSNYHHRIGGGFSYGIEISRYDQMKTNRDRNILFDTFLMSIILLIGLFNLYLYFSSKRGKLFLYFGLFAIAIVGRQIFVGENIIYTIFSEIPFNIVQKSRYLMFYAALIFATHYYAYLFPKDLHKNVVKVLTYIIIAAGVFVLLSPTYISTYVAIPMAVVGLMITIIGVYLALVGLIRKRNFSKIIFVSTFLALAFLVNDILYSRYVIDTAYLMNYGFLAFILLQSYINHKINNQEKEKLLELKASLKNMESQVNIKTKEVTQLMNETIQHLKTKENIASKLKTISTEEKNTAIESIISDLKSEKTEDAKALVLKENMAELNSEFLALLKTTHPKLTKTDLEICLFTKVGLKQKEIANLRNTTTEAVKKSRQRLRRKLNIKESLEDYLNSIGR